MLPISLLFTGRPVLGLEITSAVVRAAVTSGVGSGVVANRKSEVPERVITENYGSLNIHDIEALSRVLGECLDGLPGLRPRRAALSLPDGIFRVQTLEFDQLPRNRADRERLIRWRLEKSAAFDVSGIVLRHQVLRQNKGFTVLCCVAKQQVISQYESVLEKLGLEPWSVAPSSFHTLNFYSSYILKKSGSSALTHVTSDSFATIVVENGGVRFYRFKEIKRGNSLDIRSKLIREIEDSLHFYTHLDRAQQAGAPQLYLSGEPSLHGALADELATAVSLSVEVLSPNHMLASAANSGPEMAAAFGAGGCL